MRRLFSFLVLLWHAILGSLVVDAVMRCRLSYLVVSAPIEAAKVATAIVMTSAVVSSGWVATLGVVWVVSGMILKQTGVDGIGATCIKGLERG